ncbi:MAG TPA: acetyltransferase [Gemmatimonadaceae bacterium]|nr:acetyltransferase [Gemmatimonadaceae bacterium]
MIFGAGQGARTATRYLHDDTDHEVVGYVVDAEFVGNGSLDGKPVVAVGDATSAFPPATVHAFVPLGSTNLNALRAEKYALLKTLGYRFISYVHSSVRAYPDFVCGENCFILDGQTVNYGVSIGANVVMWSGCHLGDGSRIEDDAFLASHVVLNGEVVIGRGSFLGSNCTISRGITLGAESFIGANALITADTAPGAVHIVQATPAAPMTSRKFVKLMRNRF